MDESCIDNPFCALGTQVVFHFARNSPHPDITVVVVSFLNFNLAPLTNLLFQAAVPKVGREVGVGVE